MALMQLNIYSNVLGMQTEVWAAMPEHMQPDKKCRVLWFMPGGFADASSWIRNSSIERQALRRRVAVIMPGAYNSCCVNMHRWHKVNTYLGTELPGIIRGLFPNLSNDRMDNMVSGFSNGGYGSFNLVLSYPEVFGWGGPFGAGDKVDVDWSGRIAERDMIFGNCDLRQTNYSLRNLAGALLAGQKPLPRIFHGCGEFDPWRYMNEDLRDFFMSLSGNPFHYEFSIVDGCGHDNNAATVLLEQFFDWIGLEAESNEGH